MLNSHTHVCLAGNCQVNALEAWMKLNLPTAKINTLPPYHLISCNSEIEEWLHQCSQADYVFAVPIKEGYRNFNMLGSSVFQSMFGQKLSFYPNLYSDAFFPFFGYAKTISGETITYSSCPGNPYGDYHDFLAMALFASKLSWGKIQRLRLKLACMQATYISDNAIRSLNELQQRMEAMNSCLAGQEIPIVNVCGYSFNHPNALLLNQLYFSIWIKILKGHASHFKPLANEPFASETQLPIPSFVFKALRRIDDSLETTLHRPASDFSYYEEMLKKSMTYYSKQQWIVDANLAHPKFKAARRFLRLGLAC
jgi:hypothetical protein